MVIAYKSQLGTVLHTYHPSIGKAEARRGELQVQGQPRRDPVLQHKKKGPGTWRTVGRISSTQAQHSCKRLGSAIQASNPSARKERSEDLRVSLASQSGWNSKLLVPVRDPVSDTDVEKNERKDTQHTVLYCIRACMHTYTHPHGHIHTLDMQN